MKMVFLFLKPEGRNKEQLIDKNNQMLLQLDCSNWIVIKKKKCQYILSQASKGINAYKCKHSNKFINQPTHELAVNVQDCKF